MLKLFGQLWSECGIITVSVIIVYCPIVPALKPPHDTGSMQSPDLQIETIYIVCARLRLEATAMAC